MSEQRRGGDFLCSFLSVLPRAVLVLPLLLSGCAVQEVRDSFDSLRERLPWSESSEDARSGPQRTERTPKRSGSEIVPDVVSNSAAPRRKAQSSDRRTVGRPTPEPPTTASAKEGELEESSQGDDSPSVSSGGEQPVNLKTSPKDEPSNLVSSRGGEDSLANDQIAPPAQPRVSEILLASASARSSSEVDAQGGEALPIFSFRAHQGAVNALVVGRDGAFSGGDDGSVNFLRLFKSKGGTSVRVEKILESTRSILALALSPDEQLLAVAQTGKVSIYDRESKTVRFSLTRAKGRITSLAWDPRGELLAIGRADGDVIVWRISGGRFAGQNNIKALEVYRGANTPIVGIVFHPSSRVFFAAEDDGGLSLWRLFRAAEEMGLRDTAAEADLGREANDGKKFAQVKGRITDLWLSPDGSVVFLSAAADDGGSERGRVYSWRVRGLSPLGFFAASKEEVLSFTGFLPAVLKDKPGVNVLVASSRDQRLTLFCQRISPPRQSVQPPPFYGLLAQSGVFAQPASILRAKDDLVWGADRDGEFIIFRGNSVLSSPALSQKLRQCRN